MKLSEYTKKIGVSYRTAFRWFKEHKLPQDVLATQTPSGTILTEVNPSYSSFIGNLTYNYYDPIASAMELCRRGINKFKKSFKLIPDLDIKNIMTDKLNQVQIDHNVSTYQELFKFMRNKSYRRKEKSFLSYLLSKHSNVCLYF